MAERFPDRRLCLNDIVSMFREQGCSRLFVKELAWNHDSKRQIYLASQLSFFNIFPAQMEFSPPRPDYIPATQKKQGQGKDRIFAHLDFAWLSLNGERDVAPKAKLIFYPQYPEIRFSGFMQGTSSIPRKYLREKAGESYSDRLLFLGICENQVFGFLAVGQTDLRNELRGLSDYDSDASYNAIPLKVGKVIPLKVGKVIPQEADKVIPREEDKVMSVIELLQRTLRDGVESSVGTPLMAQDVANLAGLLPRLRDVSARGWIESCKLNREGEILPYTAPNGGGYTLEAQLGIIPNADNAPDLLGWELKQHAETMSVVTLMTPEPDMGLYREDYRQFMVEYGHEGKKKPERLYFTGPFRANIANKGLTTALEGFDPESGWFDTKGFLSLRCSDSGRLAAGWSFGRLMNVWSRKHAAAAYLKSSSKKNLSGEKDYQFHSKILLGLGTDFRMFLHALDESAVYLDPASWAAKENLKTHRRNLFRAKIKDLPKLYHSWAEFDLESIMS